MTATGVAHQCGESHACESTLERTGVRLKATGRRISTASRESAPAGDRGAGRRRCEARSVRSHETRSLGLTHVGRSAADATATATTGRALRACAHRARRTDVHAPDSEGGPTTPTSQRAALAAPIAVADPQLERRGRTSRPHPMHCQRHRVVLRQPASGRPRSSFPSSVAASRRARSDSWLTCQLTPPRRSGARLPTAPRAHRVRHSRRAGPTATRRCRAAQSMLTCTSIIRRPSPSVQHVEALAQQVEQRDRRELAQPLAIAGQARAHDLGRPARASRCRSTPCRPRRRPVRSVRRRR